MQSWRYFQVYGLFEFGLSNLSNSEIAVARRYLGTLTALEVAVPELPTTSTPTKPRCGPGTKMNSRTASSS